METRSSEWEEEKYFTGDQVSSMYLNKHNNLLTPGRCSKKDSNYSQIIALFGVAQKLADESKKSYEKPTR